MLLKMERNPQPLELIEHIELIEPRDTSFPYFRKKIQLEHHLSFIGK